MGHIINSMYKHNLGINYNNQRVQPEGMLFIQSIMSTSPCQNILLGKMEHMSFHLLKKSLEHVLCRIMMLSDSPTCTDIKTITLQFTLLAPGIVLPLQRVAQ